MRILISTHRNKAADERLQIPWCARGRKKDRLGKPPLFILPSYLLSSCSLQCNEEGNEDTCTRTCRQLTSNATQDYASNRSETNNQPPSPLPRLQHAHMRFVTLPVATTSTRVWGARCIMPTASCEGLQCTPLLSQGMSQPLGRPTSDGRTSAQRP